jgi:hypothetical protein
MTYSTVEHVTQTGDKHYCVTNPLSRPPPPTFRQAQRQNKIKILSRVSVTNNAGSGLDERVYLLLMYTISNYR